MAQGDIDVRELFTYIHSLHRQTAMLNERLAKNDRIVKVHMKKLADVQKALAEKKETLKGMIVKASDMENTFIASEESLDRRRKQLTEAKTNKEYQSLSGQISVDQLKNNQLAEETLKFQEEVEKFKAVVVEAEAEAKKYEENLAKAKKEREESIPGIKEDLAATAAKLAEEEKKIPRDFASSYRQTVDTYGGNDGLAEVVEECYCGSCRQLIPARFLVDLQSGRPYVCKSCNHMLYIKDK